ncbi:hypothetical protein BV25DRAFT_1878246 [Artomyces pyxidatus]|uniref:Uncharacterized protein n=1 Tax=Artomyces pyxidatus TaxID=48021 RepID=A0ACB8TD87_9AGAM|nr:hypothetical protein BV25DRAFT_1878246 [Artomyces pyxidatus]
MQLSPDTTQHTEMERTVTIYAGKLFDSEQGALLSARVLTVSPSSGLILDVQPYEPDQIERSAAALFADPKAAIDLRSQTLLPGLVDTHVHFFLHPYSETPWEDQLTKESLAERTVRATVHAKRTLMSGFTAVRDLGTEGAGDADIALRKCLSGPDAMIGGPRYFCANRAIVPTGSYGPKSAVYPNQEGIDGVMGAEVADGLDGCVKAVRKQIGAGADWIKIYADYRFRSRSSPTSVSAAKASICTFNQEELRTLIQTAHQYGVKVAAHATNTRTVHDLIGYGIDSIEHGNDVDFRELLLQYGEFKPFWVPTLSAYYTLGQEPGGAWSRGVKAFRQALAEGVSNIACGGDTGVFAHGDNALEMRLMVQLGADWCQVLQWATVGGWRCVRSMAWEGADGAKRLEHVGELREDPRLVGDNEVPFGVLRRGFAADVIATTGDLDEDFDAAVRKESISFVMKGGRIYKLDGRDVSDC